MGAFHLLRGGIRVADALPDETFCNFQKLLFLIDDCCPPCMVLKPFLYTFLWKSIISRWQNCSHLPNLKAGLACGALEFDNKLRGSKKIKIDFRCSSDGKQITLDPWISNQGVYCNHVELLPRQPRISSFLLKAHPNFNLPTIKPSDLTS